MATQVTNLTTQVGTVSTDMQAIARQLTTANQNRPESYVNSAPEWDGSGNHKKLVTSWQHSPTGLAAQEAD